MFKQSFKPNKTSLIYSALINLIAILTLIVTPTAFAHPVNKSTPLPKHLQHAAAAVVNISVQKKMDPELFSLLKKQSHIPNNIAPPKLNYMGSGVIVDSRKNYIITNNHVVKNSQTIIVTLTSGDHYLAHIVGTDETDDLALLQIKAKEALTEMPFANSDDAIIGQNVIAIGHPFGLNETVTAGIISAKDRTIALNPDHSQSFLQTDAPINPGNSGGALIDEDGRLIGINTAMLSTSDENAGIGFAIPSNTVHAVYLQLVKYKNVAHGMLGLVGQNITPAIEKSLQLKHDHGVIITQVNSHSAAEKAGIKTQDIIASIDHQPIKNAEQLHNVLLLHRPKTSVQLTVLRHNKPLHLQAILMTEKQAMIGMVVPHLAGMNLATYDALQADGQRTRGVVVQSMTNTCQGALAGLSVGDVIISSNHETIHNLSQLISQAEANPDSLFLTVKHQALKLYAVLR